MMPRCVLIALMTMSCTRSPQDAPSDGVITDASDAVDSGGPGPVGACDAAVIDVSVEELPAYLTRRLTVTLADDADVWVACAPHDDALETLLVESTGPATTHVLDVHGLYGASTWTCEVVPACDDAEPFLVELDLPALPASVPTFTATGVPTGVWTLLNSQPQTFGAGGRQYVIVVDPQGRPRWIYSMGEQYVLDIDATWTGDRMHMGGGWGLFDEGVAQRGVVLQVDLSGQTLLERTSPAFGLGYNHHSEPLSDGSILSLTTSRNTLGAASWYGVAVERLDPVTGLTPWTWDSQSLVDDGLEGPESDSPWHANALSLTTDPGGEALWISLYIGAAIWRIDPATGARTHVFGAGGDFTLVNPAGDALPASEWPWRQHDPEYTEDGRILVYDNGVGRPGGAYSRVAEYQVDLESRVATLLWTWTEPNWYTPIVGDADYLPSGHVLVTKGVVRALTPWLSARSAVIEVDPGTDEVVWRLEFDDPAMSVFRSERYDGCAMFHSARYCPQVASRLAALRATLPAP